MQVSEVKFPTHYAGRMQMLLYCLQQYQNIDLFGRLNNFMQALKTSLYHQRVQRLLASFALLSLDSPFLSNLSC